MDINTAFSIVDDTIYKIAETERDYILKEASDIIDVGYEKLAAGESFLKGVKNVLTGNNLAEASKNLNLAKNKSTILGNVGSGIDNMPGKISNLSTRKRQEFLEKAKDMGIRTSKNGEILNTKYRGSTADQLATMTNQLKSQLGTEGRNISQNRKSIQETVRNMEKARRPVAPDSTGIKGVADRVFKAREFADNKAYNEVIDKLNEVAKSNRTINPSEYVVKRKNLLGRERVIQSDEVRDYIKNINKANAGINKSTKKVNRIKSQIGDITHEQNLAKNIKDINARQQAIRDADKLRDIAGATKGVKDVVDEVSDAFKGNKKHIDAAKSNYNKELAKTVGAYTAIGGGLYAGSKALNNKRQQQQQQQPPHGPYQQQFYPQYR